jgi:diguanylate cyclase (GGDEF)-like protein/PAS domain S-box-containing protein
MRRARAQPLSAERSHARSGAATLVLVGLVYFAVAKLGLSFAADHDIVSAVWPPSGLALAAAVVLGARVWPAILVAAFLSNATGDSALGTSAGIATGNALAAVIASRLLARADFDPALRRIRDVVALAVLGAGASTAVNATIGVGSLWAAGIVEPDTLWSFWRVWWLGDLTGVLLVAPALLILGGNLRKPLHRVRIAEASLLAAALVAAMLIVLDEGVTLAYPIFPLIVLAAMRFRQPGAVVAALLVSALAVAYTANDRGPFTGGSADTDLLSAQVFVALAAMTALLVAAMRTEWERAEALLARLGESERALAEAQRLAQIGSWTWDVGADRLRWSDELYRIFGLDRDEFGASYESYLACVHPEDRALVEREVRAAAEQATSFRFEHRIVRPDGEVRTIDSRGHAAARANGRAAQLCGTAQDVTERRLIERRLEHQALHDPLTDLPNRALFLDRLEHALARARRPASNLAVYFCDVDDFKVINDGLGHETGDALLTALPPRLCAAVRAADTVARFGGDEFVILCEDLASEEEANDIARRIAEAFAAPFELDGRRHHLSVSVGVVLVKGGHATATEVLRDADAAMYRAKSGGKGRFEVFDAGMRASLVERLQTETDLRRAIEAGELRLLYQPMLSLDADEFVGAEALVRWQHPERGLLSPAAFIEVAEDSGLIVSLGAWVLEEACRQAAAWAAATGVRRVVSVNLSPRQIVRSQIPELLVEALARTGADASMIELEITENVLMEQTAAARDTLRELKCLGVRLVLDDFGTGYSSLSHLKRFPIDALKIDREFIDGLGVEAEDTAIVEAVLSMARALEIGVIAEGVETAEQLAWLRERRCDLAQGYLIARPLAADELDRLDGWATGVGAPRPSV